MQSQFGFTHEPSAPHKATLPVSCIPRSSQLLLSNSEMRTVPGDKSQAPESLTEWRDGRMWGWATSVWTFVRASRTTRRSGKEVIQPQVPLRLPCYDFAPVTELALGRSLLAVGTRTSGTPGFHGVTGGVYKARERIHRGVADPRLLAIPASCRRVADDNPH